MGSARRAGLGAWARFALLVVVTAVVLLPLVPVLLPVVVARDGSSALPSLVTQLTTGPTLAWLRNSVLVSLATVVVTVAVAAPAGYAIARGRGRVVDAFSVLLLVLQSLPGMVLLPALFVLLVHVGAGDSLGWLIVLYVGFSLAVATWTTTSWFATLPVEVEEAAWLDGCGPLAAFARVVLPGSGPVLLSTALITFLFAWNDYWIALLFLQDPGRFTVGLALVGAGRTPALALVALLPPVVAFLVLHRWFRIGAVPAVRA